MPQESYTLYLDASGGPGWPKPLGNDPDKHYILGGFAMTPQMDSMAQIEVGGILDNYLGQPAQGNYELNYNDLIHGEGPYRALQDTTRLAMADDVFRLLLRMKPVAFATVLDKEKHLIRYGANAHSPRPHAFRATVDRFCKFLNRNNAIGYVTMDSEQFRNDRNLQLLVRNAKKYGISLTGMLYQPSCNSKLKPLINTPSFLPSHDSPGLQLADFCAKVVFLSYARGKHNRFSEIEPLFDRTGDRRWEPSLIPKDIE
jgi:hypothetical protein